MSGVTTSDPAVAVTVTVAVKLPCASTAVCGAATVTCIPSRSIVASGGRNGNGLSIRPCRSGTVNASPPSNAIAVIVKLPGVVTSSTADWPAIWNAVEGLPTIGPRLLVPVQLKLLAAWSIGSTKGAWAEAFEAVASARKRPRIGVRMEGTSSRRGTAAA